MAIEPITLEEWYAELESLTSKTNDEGWTTTELVESLGIPERKIRKILKTGVLSGRIKVGRRWVAKDWDGKPRSYPVYKVVSP